MPRLDELVGAGHEDPAGIGGRVGGDQEAVVAAGGGAGEGGRGEASEAVGDQPLALEQRVGGAGEEVGREWWRSLMRGPGGGRELGRVRAR